jgi:hypothetical protein
VAGGAAALSGQLLPDIPDSFLCPLSQRVMTDPVVTPGERCGAVLREAGLTSCGELPQGDEAVMACAAAGWQGNLWYLQASYTSLPLPLRHHP